MKIGILDPEGLNPNPLTNEPYTSEYKALAKSWSKLPGYSHASEIIKSITNNQITIAIMGTGTGKSVLIPKFALHYTNYEGKIAMTLPKKILASSAAKFASETLDVILGEHIGYVYKGKNMTGPKNKIVYMTDGVLVMQMVRDPDLSEYKVIIIDEAHERKIQIDLILQFVKKLLLSGRRPDLRVVLMSATIDGQKYQQYFNGISSHIISVAGKTNHPIETKFLSVPIKDKDYLKPGLEIFEKLREEKIKKDALFFITTSKEAIDACKYIRPKYPSVYCVEVYADMDEQTKLYAQDRDKYSELGNYDQKLVLATNVAESSLTIDGLRYVIDSGYELYSYFDPDTTAQILKTRLITKAQALQRRGRVGRTEPGICYTLLTEDQFNALDDYAEPDILKQDITIETLKIISQTKTKHYTEGHEILKQLMDIPKQSYVDYSYNLLTMYKILDADNYAEPKLTADILQFSSLSLNRSLFLIFAFQLYCGKEASEILGMMESLKNKIANLFYKADTLCESDYKKESSKAYLNKITDKTGDHITLLKIYEDYKFASDREVWAKKNGIILRKLKNATEIANQYYRKLINRMNAPQVGGAVNADTKKKLIEALKRSHLHLTAKNLTTTYPKIKNESKISPNSILYLVYNKKELATKKIIYDEFTMINGNSEFNIVTII